MACTIRIASENAKFGQPEVKLGLLPGGGGTQRLPRLVGKGRALQLILTGGIINAAEAYRIGLVNEVVPAAQLIARAEAILNEIFSNAPLAVKFSLQVVNDGMETTLAEGLALEASFFGLCAGTEDKKEGTTAFLEKRKFQQLIQASFNNTRQNKKEHAHGNGQHFFGTESGGLCELHRRSRRGGDFVGLRRRGDQGRTADGRFCSGSFTRFRLSRRPRTTIPGIWTTATNAAWHWT